MLCLLQTSAMLSMGSKAPKTVVPAVAFTKNGIFPSATTASMALSSSSGIIRPLSSAFTFTRFSVPIPSQLTPFVME